MKVSQGQLKSLRGKLRKAQDISPVRRAVIQAGEDLLRRSIEVTPKREGDLRGSGSADPFDGPQGPGIDVSFSSPYALPVHENLDTEVNWSEPNTGPKFLEQPFLENKKRYTEHIMEAGRKQLR